MKPGRRPTPVRLKLLRGNPGQRRIGDVFDPPKPPKPLEPPDFLTGRALEEWHRVAPSLTVMGLLCELDVMPLASYCTACGRWIDAETLLKELANLDDKAKGLLVRGSKGQARANPLIQVSREAAADMIRAADEFGFSPAARSRIALGPFVQSGQQGGKFAGLIGRDGEPA
jgi:P27 family predicted phage terminase small subunit